ncbi:MAG: siderophore-interacting protein [Pseudomonadota bacterium]|nr:siderophore-interacting protein [Pseudomonadota bacterium]
MEAEAGLDIAPGVAKQGFRAAGVSAGLRVTDTEHGVILHFARGDVTISPGERGTKLTIAAGDAAGLQLIRDTIAERVAGMGLTLDWATSVAGTQPGNMSIANVTSVKRLSPAYMRLILEGDDLARFADGPLHFRLLFGPEGTNWPTLNADGVTVWPGGAEAWHRPVYTTREIETRPDGSGRITFDVFMHEGGRTTAWAQSVAVGEQIAMTGPGGGNGAKRAGTVALFGDETAVPVIARILAELPVDARGQATMLVPSREDIQNLTAPDGIEIKWILRDWESSLLTSLKTAPFPNADRFVFFASERSEVFAARDWLNLQGWDRTEFLCASYWTA